MTTVTTIAPRPATDNLASAPASGEVLVRVENVRKKFCRSLKKSLWYGMKDIAHELNPASRRRSTGGTRSLRAPGCESLRDGEFWAVDDVSFELRRGECLGLIGHNGAGKTTLLKMLNGLIKPDGGRIEMRGRVGALIALGAGFNPVLTGRENIHVNGSVLGFTKSEINQKLDEIVEFAEIGDFIDSPVQNYSSGMAVRLGFSVAVHLDPDILILDEVLAVGDGGFKIKSYNKMAKMMSKAAVIFVTHSMPIASRVCNHLMVMDRGRLSYHGDNIALGVEKYMDMFAAEERSIEYGEMAEVSSININGKTGSDNDALPVFNYLDDLIIETAIRVNKDIATFEAMLQFTDKDMKIVAQFFANQFQNAFNNTGEWMQLRFELPECVFTNGEYALTLFVTTKNLVNNKTVHLLVYRNCSRFKMRGLDGAFYAPVHLKGHAYIE